MEAGAKYGEYQLGRRLGVGGQGEVFEATDGLGLRWALKIGHAVHTEDTKTLTNFAREAAWVNETFARLPRNCGILVGEHYGVCERRFYVKMRLLTGESLAMRLQREPALSTHEALEIACAVAAAVSIAHQNDALHRDLKPENIFIEDGGTIQVLDWGCIQLIEAERLAASTAAGPTCTVGYAALEQYDPASEKLSTATDVYSLGVVLLEMLTGGNPFLGRSRSSNTRGSLTTRTAAVSASRTTAINPVHHRATSRTELGESTSRTSEFSALSEPIGPFTSGAKTVAPNRTGETTGPWRDAGNLRTVLRRQQEFKVEDWLRVAPLDSNLVALLKRMLESDVQHRDASMREVQAALEQLLDPTSPTIHRDTRRRPRGYQRWVVVGAVMLAGAFTAVMSRKAPDSAEAPPTEVPTVVSAENESAALVRASTSAPASEKQTPTIASSLTTIPAAPSSVLSLPPDATHSVPRPPLPQNRPQPPKRTSAPSNASVGHSASPVITTQGPPAFFTER